MLTYNLIPTSLPLTSEPQPKTSQIGSRCCSCSLEPASKPRTNLSKRLFAAAAAGAIALVNLHPAHSCHLGSTASSSSSKGSESQSRFSSSSTSDRKPQTSSSAIIIIKHDVLPADTADPGVASDGAAAQSIVESGSRSQRDVSVLQSSSPSMHPSSESTSTPSPQPSSLSWQPPNSLNSSYQAKAALLSDWAAQKASRRPSTPNPFLRAPMSRVRPTTVGLVGVGAVTSGSMLLRHAQLQMRTRRFHAQDVENELLSRLHNVCTVVCMQIPFCVSERSKLLQRLERLLFTASCSDAASMACACRSAAALLLGEDGVLEDSRRFAPHVDLFLAESFAEAERRFCAHVTIEGSRLERLNASTISESDGDYGVVTMIVATTEGINLCCYSDGITNLQRLCCALDSISRLKEGEVAGLELLWVPETVGTRRLSRAQMADVYPSLRIA